MNTDKPTTLERLRHYKLDHFKTVGSQYINELIHNAAIELGAAEEKLLRIGELRAVGVPLAPECAFWESEVRGILNG